MIKLIYIQYKDIFTISLISGTTHIKRVQLNNLDNALYSQERILFFDCNILLIHLICIIFRNSKSIIIIKIVLLF